MWCSLAESLELNTSLRAELNACVNRERELAEANQMLRDEYQALQLAFAALEEKLRKAQVNIFHHKLSLLK